MSKPRLKRLLIGCASLVAAFVLVIVALMAFWFWHGDQRWSKPEADLVNHAATLQQDVSALIAAHTADGVNRVVRPADLPVSLQITGLQYAVVHADYVALVIYTSPDTQSGFRIWADNPNPDYADKPTALPYVMRFRYCDDDPDSPTNRVESQWE
ncbi:MAG: hypothetical protein IT441_02835 [Phycisphaeraceae bacterium]|nr:hypothetical protein [Phycisphaeraceae bacterium]